MQTQALLHMYKEESETFGSPLMSMHGPCTRMTVTADLTWIFHICHSSIMQNAWIHWRPCGSSKKVRVASCGFADVDTVNGVGDVKDVGD